MCRRMTMEEAISALQFDMDMMLFDPYTGDSYSKEILENKSKHGNSMDYPVYCAKEVAIKSIQTWDEVLAELERELNSANNTYNKYNNNVDLGRVFGIERAIEIIKQKLGEVDE